MNSNSKDTVFKQKLNQIEPFSFNEHVAEVFDDMINRSIPFYKEIHQLILDLVDIFYREEGIIYDLGSSTGTTILLIDQFLRSKNLKGQFVGIDSSLPMIKKSREKLKNITAQTELIHGDITKASFKNANIVILNYTLQFIPLEQRPHLLKKIYDNLLPNSILIISEKIKSPNTVLQDLITKLYYDFKKNNGYSELEISQKREALEDVLIPLTSNDQIELLKQAGFQNSEEIFRWYNFASYIGVKK